MRDEATSDEEMKRAGLLLELDLLQSEIQRRLLTLVEHPAVSEEFKCSSVVQGWIK